MRNNLLQSRLKILNLGISMKPVVLRFGIFLTFVLLSPLSSGEVLKLNGGPVEVLKAVDAPVRGMSKQAVEKRFGAPLRKEPAVGKPAISSWEYPGYTVFFENHLVIHTVTRTKTGK